MDVSRDPNQRVHRAGIARSIALGWSSNPTDQAPGIVGALERLNLALAESPAPEFEWQRLADILGSELLTRLVGISATSVRRYKAAARTTPDDVAQRLHALTLAVGELSGTYNDMGIRQWFDRKRAQLGERAPAELLRGAWHPGAPGPAQVWDLARSLAASPAT